MSARHRRCVAVATPQLLAARSCAPASARSSRPRRRAHARLRRDARLGSASRAARPGRPASARAADYIAAQLARIGARPLPGRDGHVRAVRVHGRQPRRRLARDASRAAQARRARSTAPATCWRCRSPTTATCRATVVFAGYGIVVPESQNFGYDSYAGARRQGQGRRGPALLPRGRRPGRRAPSWRATPTCATRRWRRGSAAPRALLVVTGPRVAQRRRHDADDVRHGARRLGHQRGQRQRRVAQALFAAAGRSQALQKALDSGNPHVRRLRPPASRVTLKTARRPRRSTTGRNVVAYLPATAPRRRRRPSRGWRWAPTTITWDAATSGNSLRRTRAGRPGARRRRRQRLGHRRGARRSPSALAKRPMRRGTCSSALWSAEEIGLIGSAAFVATPPVPPTDLAAYLNFDMVGRMRGQQAGGAGHGHQPGVGVDARARRTSPAGFDLALQPDPYQPTDVANFNQAGVPSLSFTTGAHTDYHKPSDTADKINYEDLDRVAAHGRGHRRPRDGHGAAAGVRQGRAVVSRPRTAPACASSPARCPTTRRPPRGCCSAAWSAAGRRSRRGCRRATSSSRSPARRSPTSTTTPTRSSC